MSTDARPDPEPTAHQRPWTPEKRDDMSERVSALWANPAYRATMCAKMREGHLRKRLAKRRTA